MFQQKYPAFYALISLLAQAAVDVAADVSGKVSLLQAVLGAENLAPLLMQLYPVAGQLGAEAAAMSPADIEAAAELLVTDLQFSSAKAQAIIKAAFPVAESLVAVVPQVQALVAAIKS